MLLVLLFLLPRLAFAQPPAIDQEGVRNAAGRIPPSLPGGEIAPGAVIEISGLRLGGEVHIRQKGSNWVARVISSRPELLQAIVPPQVAPGDAGIVVARDGQDSRPFPIRVASTAFGIAEIRRSGRTATLLGTGLGHIRDVEVIVGGHRSPRILSHGPQRGRPGWESIRFVLPRDAPRGCNIPVIVRSGDHVSNAVILAHPAKEQHCPGAAPYAAILLARARVHVQLSDGHAADFQQDVAAAVFSETLRTALDYLPPMGTCTAYTTRLTSAPSLASLGGLAARMPSGRSAGPEITITGPMGTKRLTAQPQNPGVYAAMLGHFLEDGDYRISGTGFAGNAHVGPPVEISHPERLKTIDRRAGATIDWKGATADQQVVVAAANVDPFTSAGAICLCAANGAAGQLRIDPLWLAHFPASQNMPGVPLNYVLVASVTARPNLVLVTSIDGRTVKFQ